MKGENINSIYNNILAEEMATTRTTTVSATTTATRTTRTVEEELPCMWCEFGGWNKPGCSQNLPCRDQALAFSDCIYRLSDQIQHKQHKQHNKVSECNARARELEVCLSGAPPYVQDIVGRNLDLYAVAKIKRGQR